MPEHYLIVTPQGLRAFQDPPPQPISSSLVKSHAGITSHPSVGKHPIPPRSEPEAGVQPNPLYRGWSWWGGNLPISELVALHPDSQTSAWRSFRSHLGEEQDHPVVFGIYAHEAWASLDTQEQLSFPLDTRFWVREFRVLPGNRVRLCLEQAIPGLPPDPSLDRLFRRWLRDKAGQAHRSAPWPHHLDPKWQAMPSGCYVVEDAIRFVSERKGLGRRTVALVLQTKLHYLELLGLAQGGPKEGRRRERRCACLIPPPPTLEGPLLMAYLIQETRLNIGLIQSVLAGERIYLASQRLAPPSPDELEADWDPWAELPEFDHVRCWESVLDKPLSAPPMLPLQPEHEELHFAARARKKRWKAVVATLLPESSTLATLRLDWASEDGWDQIAAVPMVRDGAPCVITIREVFPSRDGAQALVQGWTASGTPVSFLFLEYLAPKVNLKNGHKSHMRLAAFAESLAPLRPPPPDSDQPSSIPFVHADKDGRRDLFCFRGVIESVGDMDVWGQPFLRLAIAVQIGETPLTLPVYAAAHVLPADYRPKAGEAVYGRIWVQGSLPEKAAWKKRSLALMRLIEKADNSVPISSHKATEDCETTQQQRETPTWSDIT